jgi:hypothetical protein
MSMARRIRLARRRAEKLIPATKLRMQKVKLQINRLVQRRTNRLLEKIAGLGRTMNLQIL